MPQGTECPALGGARQADATVCRLQLDYHANHYILWCLGWQPRDLVVCYANVVTRVKVVNHLRVLFRA